MDWRKIISYLFLIVAWFLIGFFVRGFNILPIDALDTELALIREAGQILSAQAYNEPPPARQMTYGAIQGLLASIDDPYVEFWDPHTVERYNLEFQGNDAVIGLQVGMVQGQFVVADLTPGLPAQQAGLQQGDVLIEIDNWKIPRNTAEALVTAMIRGPVGSTAHLVVSRNNQTLTFDVPRKPSEDITTRLLESDVAYLRLDRFTTQTGPQMESALKQLLASNPRAIIWDLRFNGGGAMDATQQSLDLFLDEGMAFYGQLRDGSLIPYPTVTGGIAEKIPLVVLIGPHSYSAPETVAASIRDRERGILIGDTTHGKGSIITLVNLSDGSAIRFTAARWLSPVMQQSYEGQGVPADIIVRGDSMADDDAVLEAALDYLRGVQP